MLTEHQHGRLALLQQRELEGALTEPDRSELEQLVRLIQTHEAAYLRPATERLKQERLKIEEQNAAIRHLIQRQERLARRLKRVLDLSNNEREAIKAELTYLLGSTFSRFWSEIRVRAEDRRNLRARYNHRCGYCGIHETDAGSELTADHFQPSSRGGSDTVANLVYCCHACNEFKGDYWPSVEQERLLYPLLNNIAEHIVEIENGMLRPLSPRGEIHIQRLHLNRIELVAHRLERRERDRLQAEQQQLLKRLTELEQYIELLQAEIAGGELKPKQE